jgi:uncharacterized protein YacL
MPLPIEELKHMSANFIASMLGMLFFGLIGARIGADNPQLLNFDRTSAAILFGFVGILIGIILTPYLTVRPVMAVRRAINELPIERFLLTLVGALVGLLLSVFLVYPLSLLGAPWGQILPLGAAIAFAYLGMNAFSIRSREIADAFSERLARSPSRASASSSRKLILDTSVLIDGRIADVIETGFLGGTIIVPRFVMSELHTVADSADLLRRNRGKRGLQMLNRIHRTEIMPVRIVEDDFEDIPQVDNKLVALAIQMAASIVTNDYNLGQVAEAQNVPVLNINQLSKAVRSLYIPEDVFTIRVVQEGRDMNQGVGYLDDGTMVVVENGKLHMDRNVKVRVTKLIERDTGRMIFAVPENEPRRPFEEQG